MVCISSESQYFFKLAQTKFKLAIFQIDFSVFNLHCVDLEKFGRLG